MSADVLREAARLIRARAEAVGDDWYSAKAWATTAPMNLPIERADAEHIASWHPDVALAVADWLDDEADDAERFQAQTRAPRLMVPRRALAVARAYLGGAA